MILALLLTLQQVPPPPGSVPPPQGQVTCPDGALPLPTGSCPRFIFFDSGKAEIRREWLPVIDEAASAAKAGNTRLAVTGHSDTVGSSAGNRRMSRMRAEAVAEALAARGIDRSRIAITVAGEDQPLVPTAKGVREIQNRRVHITLER